MNGFIPKVEDDTFVTSEFLRDSCPERRRDCHTGIVCVGRIARKCWLIISIRPAYRMIGDDHIQTIRQRIIDLVLELIQQVRAICEIPLSWVFPLRWEDADADDVGFPVFGKKRIIAWHENWIPVGIACPKRVAHVYAA